MDILLQKNSQPKCWLIAVHQVACQVAPPTVVGGDFMIMRSAVVVEMHTWYGSITVDTPLIRHKNTHTPIDLDLMDYQAQLATENPRISMLT